MLVPIMFHSHELDEHVEQEIAVQYPISIMKNKKRNDTQGGEEGYRYMWISNVKEEVRTCIFVT